MSEATSKVRWPWVVVAVIGLCGALFLPLQAMRSKSDQAMPSVPQHGEGATEPHLTLKPATRPATTGRLGQPDPTLKPEVKEDDKVAAGPLGPPDPNTAGDGPAEQAQATTSPRQIQQQLPGRFALSAPTNMEVARSEHVTLVAAVEQLRALVTTELQAVTGDGSTQTVSTKDVPLSRLLRIELRADSDADFEIKAFTQPDQRLSNQQATTWEWSVTPKSDGDKHLTVIISNLVDGQGQPIAVTISRRNVHVTKSWTQQARDLSSMATSAASALAGLIGTWLGLLKPLIQRRREEEAKQGTKPDTKPEAKPEPKPEPKPEATAAINHTTPAAAKPDPHSPT